MRRCKTRRGMLMTDEEPLKEIDWQEKRFAAAGCVRGLRLAKFEYRTKWDKMGVCPLWWG